MTPKGENLTDECKNKQNVNRDRDIAFKRSEHAEAYGRANQCQLWKTDRARRRRNHCTDGPEPVEKRLLHLAGSISVTVNAPPVPAALNFTLSPALTLSSMAGSLT